MVSDFDAYGQFVDNGDFLDSLTGPGFSPCICLGGSGC